MANALNLNLIGLWFYVRQGFNGDQSIYHHPLVGLGGPGANVIDDGSRLQGRCLLDDQRVTCDGMDVIRLLDRDEIIWWQERMDRRRDG